MPVAENALRQQNAVFIIAGLGAGGVEKVVSLIATAWITKGWQVTILAFDRPEDPIYHDFHPAVEIRRLGLSSGGGKIRSVIMQGRRILAIRRALNLLQPDIVISLLTKINLLTLVATIGTSHKVIVSERNNPQAQPANAAWNILLARFYGRAEAIVMQTRASMDCLPPNVRAKARIIPNPILPPQSSQLINMERRVVSAVGRLTYQKGFDLLIDAFARIASRHPDWKLMIWGEGEMRPALEMQVRALGLNDQILLPGTSEIPGGWVHETAIMALSSRFEGFPNALGEAMASGLPVVAFDCPFGPSDLIIQGIDGLLIPPGDVPALARAIERLIVDQQLRKCLGSAARRSVSRLTPTRIVAQWEVLVRESLTT
ncbi:MAG: glycosyltransferase family 4 protein [Sphingobium sp.]|uniref:glycosyltransferase family 4 protein n=1 Tax=Sphingobium sp. CECT 9361 TaxID=2845384 RepID=UPI001E4D1AFD|nr:glycosyltransferase family 4 protein [Sphingobium sp. CECT 9361]